MIDWQIRSEKQKVTYPAIFNRPFKSVLSLSGKTCTDLEYGLRVGAITPQTHIDVVEQKTDISNQIKRKLKTLGLVNATVHITPLHKFHTRTHYDLMNIDLLGNLTRHLFQWLFDMRNQILPGGTLNVTSFKKVRANTFVPTLCAFMRDEKSGLNALFTGLENRYKDWAKATVHLLLAEYILQSKTFNAELLTYHDQSDMLMMCYQNICPETHHSHIRTNITTKINEILTW